MRRPAAQLLDELRRLDEHERIEAKRGLGKEALFTVVALANEPGLGGGWILFGVEARGDSYEVVGVPDPDRVCSDLAAQCSDQTLSRPLRPEIWTEELENARVVVAFVPELSAGDKPVYLTRHGLPRGAYRRVGSTDQQGSAEDLDRYRDGASVRPYEDTLVLDARMDDFDRGAITKYRQGLIDANPASELRDLALEEVVEALGGCRRDEGGVMRPTVAGILLFAKPLALRRLMPAARIDYLVVDGTKWVQDTQRPFDSVLEVRAPLLEAFRRVYRALLDDLPRSTRFSTGNPQRHEDAAVPERVLREALVNAITHRSYRVHQPTQVIRYRNRIEIRNAGHSLVEEDQLGKPGSQPRNPRIADVFREMHLAENKGTGIGVMRREMKEAHLSPPLFESDRGGDRFNATLLFHHLLGENARGWLASLKDHELSDEQAIALVFARDDGRVSNSVLRDLTGLDTLGASLQLRKLRDLGLLQKQGSGTASYYVLGPKAGPAVEEAAKEATEETGSQYQTNLFDRREAPLESDEQGFPADEQGFPADEQGFPADEQGLPEEQGLPVEEQGLPVEEQGSPLDEQAVEADGHWPPDEGDPWAELPPELRRQIEQLGARPRRPTVQRLLVALCTVRPMRPAELASLLGRRSVNALVRHHLTPLVDRGELERTHPGRPAHPRQAYRAVKGREA